MRRLEDVSKDREGEKDRNQEGGKLYTIRQMQLLSPRECEETAVSVITSRHSADPLVIITYCYGGQEVSSLPVQSALRDSFNALNEERNGLINPVCRGNN